ncbi:hypothetical protein SBRCBS47491_008484 [Sporothrix bragantina]|uniref:Uncharacterized protein n=1 Tax=Sporothrix bragantina TaxID=671064 RepID=A0ABP0CPX6_9PEZI
MLSPRVISSAAPVLRQAVRPRPTIIGRRWNSSSSEPSAYSSFFKTFGRPITKVCLMAVFTYQLAFFGWTKLEQDEIRNERQAEISSLEAKVKDLQESKKA